MEKTRELSPEEEHCYRVLLKWKARCDEVMSLYDRTKPSPCIPPNDIDRARYLYARLMHDLRNEDRRLENSRTRTPAEDRWCRRPVHEAVFHLRAPTNAAPDRWHADLDEARRDIAGQLDSMRAQFGITTESDRR